MDSNDKRNFGMYYTINNIWVKDHIKKFVEKSNCNTVVDPFAGGGDILKLFEKEKNINTVGYDIDGNLGWYVNDSLIDIPFTKNSIVITNPPYLSKNSAKRRGLCNYKYFDGNTYVDLYQIAIDKVLQKFDYAVFIIPETFLRSNFFKEALHSITIIEESLFLDTDCPICICCFDKNYDSNFDIFKGDLFLMDYHELKSRLKRFDTNCDISISFNDLNGNLGLRGIDSTEGSNRIKFCLPQDLNYDISKIKVSSRAITLIKVDIDVDTLFIDRLNDILEDYRMRTHDVFLAPFKNNTKNGTRRRRLDFDLARKFINKTIEMYYERI
jgi:hypothetical protein